MKLMKYQNSSILTFNVKIKEKHWVLGFISSFFLTIIFLCLLVAFLYESMMIRSNRLPNIRQVNEQFRLNIVKDFIDLSFNSTEKYSIVLGDSQFYGLNMAEVNTFPHILNMHSLDKKVVNLSIVDGRPTDALIVLKNLLDKNIKLETIIYSINFTHFLNGTVEGFGRLPKDISSENILRHSFKILKNYWVDWLLYEKADWKRSEHLIINKDAKPTFSSKPRRNVKYLVELLELIKTNSEDHLIVLSAFSDRALVLNKTERDSFLAETSYFKSLVQENKGRVKDLTFELSDDDFLDTVHFSRKGHQRVANLLEHFIISPSALKN
jgi:hypothetical protein